VSSLRRVPDLLVINDEAHHVRKGTDWYAQIEDLHRGLQRKGGGLSAQLDLTATPRHTNRGNLRPDDLRLPAGGGHRAGRGEDPVLPDSGEPGPASHTAERQVLRKVQRSLGPRVREWHRSYDELVKAGKKSVLFRNDRQHHQLRRSGRVSRRADTRN